MYVIRIFWTVCDEKNEIGKVSPEILHIVYVIEISMFNAGILGGKVHPKVLKGSLICTDRCVCVCVCLCTCIFSAYVNVCVCVCLYVYVYIYMYLILHMQIHFVLLEGLRSVNAPHADSDNEFR